MAERKLKNIAEKVSAQIAPEKLWDLHVWNVDVNLRFQKKNISFSQSRDTACQRDALLVEKIEVIIKETSYE